MRELRCTRCEELVTVLEFVLDQRPCPFIDPALFVCGQCHRPVPGQMQLGDEPRTETRPYEPETAQIPF